MRLLDDLGKKAKEISDVAHINSLINQSENKLNNIYYQIGKLYVSIHTNDYEEEFASMVSTVMELEQEIKKYRRQIQDVRGVQRCSQCGAEVPQDGAFCSSCGNAISKVEVRENIEDSVKCLNCGSYVKNGMRFCTSCGKPVEQVVDINTNGVENETEVSEKICPNCGVKSSDNAVFCAECGTKL